MATLMKPTKATDREVNLNKTIKLPRDRYTIRIKDETFEISKSSGNPMIVLSPELVAPDVITNPVDGSKVNIAGFEMKKIYLSLRSSDPAKSQGLFDRYSDLRTKLGVPINEEEGIDIENPPKVLMGLVCDAICDGEEFLQRKDPTPEQRAKNQPGNPLKDAQGKEIKSYFPYVVEILGLADQSLASGRPF